MTNSSLTYLKAAKEQYDLLKSFYYESSSITGAYWQLGTSFDSIIDFLQIAIEVPELDISVNDARDFLQAAATNYVHSAGCWYDDFGWWGIAFSKALDPFYSNLFGSADGSLVKEFTNKALQCWDTMKNGKGDGFHHGAPNAFKYADKTYFSGVAPMFENGVWQYDIFVPRRPSDCSPSDCNPPTPIDVLYTPTDTEYPAVKLGPYQLTVVNGLYFVLGQRLANAGTITKVSQKEIDDLWGFVYNWCYSDKLTTDQKLFNWFGTTDSGLFHERVSIYANGDAVYTAPGISENEAWAGDQGLMLGALVAYEPHNTTETKEGQDLINGLTNGTLTKIVGPTKDGVDVLMPWYPVGGDAPGKDTGDYCSGSGVFMRYLLYGYRNNASVQNLVKTTYHQLIKDTADACVANKYITLLDCAWNSAYFDPFNKLAVLTTASQVL